MGADDISRRLLHHVLRLQSPVRPPDTLHLSGGPQRPPVSGNEDRPAEQAETLQGQQQVRMQEAKRLELHHANVNSSRHSVFTCRDTRGCRHDTAHHFQHYGGDIGLPHREHIDIDNELLHYHVVSDQLCDILWHVAAVSGDVQGVVHKRGCD